MESVAPPETRPSLAVLRRLRASSTRMPVAIENDDMAEIERLAGETEQLIDAVRPSFADGRPEGQSSDLVEEIAAMNRMIVHRLQERRREVAAEIHAASQLKTRLRAIRSGGPCEGDEVDRET